MKNQQQLLQLQLTAEYTFATFYGDPTLVHMLTALAEGHCEEDQLFLWGATNTGKTHLLHAVCHHANHAGNSVLYLPCHELLASNTDVLEGFQAISTVCLDGVDLFAGHQAWEYALFDFINRMRAQGTSLLLTANKNPGQQIFDLADLNSRVVWGPVYKLPSLSQVEVEQALLLHAHARGLELGSEGWDYLFKHCRRDTSSLVAILALLDDESLRHQRRLTLPFLRQVLNAQETP